MLCCCSSPVCEKYGCQSWMNIKSPISMGHQSTITDTVKTGWICPNCNKSNAPWMPYCCKAIIEEIKEKNA